MTAAAHMYHALWHFSVKHYFFDTIILAAGNVIAGAFV